MKIGAAFGDHIKTGRIQKRRYKEDQVLHMRPGLLLVVLGIVCFILLLKLTNLQLFNGTYYRALADTNRTRTRIVHAPRGVLFDRHGTPLVYNIPGFREIRGKKTRLITREKALAVLAREEDAERLEIDSLRQYPLEDSAAHILGYVGQISEDELSLPAYSSYNITDVTGKTGLERYYEHVLKGTDGRELIEVDAIGKPLRVLGQTDPIPGKDITLTIDAPLQEAAFEAVKDHTKAVVIASTLNGEILAMVSKPSFDPNLFTMGTTSASDSAYLTVDAILSDTSNQPMMNRGITGVYPPGSTFKLITAAAGLETGTIDKNYIVEDTGVIRIGEFSFGNWFWIEQGRKDGKVDVAKAISRSNDIFFYRLAEKVKVDTISNIASEFGVGKKLGIDLYGEEKGLLPTQEWKKRVMKEPWYLGDTYHYGIGQGYLLTTPLQVNVWTQAIANGGTVYQPHLVKREKDVILNEGFISDKSIDPIRQGMIDSCEEGGVAWPLFGFQVKNAELEIDGRNFLAVPQASKSADMKDYRHVTVACKTGTAQHGGQVEGENVEPHASITLFAPAYDPEIVVTVLVESAGQGSSVAGPVAKKVLEKWFGHQK